MWAVRHTLEASMHYFDIVTDNKAAEDNLEAREYPRTLMGLREGPKADGETCLHRVIITIGPVHLRVEPFVDAHRTK